jgi:hypothetical protein
MEMKIRDFIIAAFNKIRPDSHSEIEKKIKAQYEDETPKINTKEITDSMTELNYETKTEEQPETEFDIKCEEPDIVITTESDIEDEHEGCSKIMQKKCLCQSCGNIYYYSDEEISHVANVFIGKFYTSSQMEDFRQCPRCGDFTTMHKNVCFWIDNKGNCVDVEESAFIKPTAPDTFQNIRHDFGHCNS